MAATQASGGQATFAYPERNGCCEPVSGSYVCRQVQPVSFVSRWMETDVSAEVVVTRWMSSCGGKQCVQVTRPERAPLDERQRVAVAGVDLLVLLAAIETDESPGEMVVDGGRRAGRNDQREEGE